MPAGVRVAAAVACGGALGAVLRVVVDDLARRLGLPAWGGVLVVNTIGGVAIGAAFVHLEARFLRRTRSRLAATPQAGAVERRGWLLDPDQTLDPVDLFRAEGQLRIVSGGVVTGLLGGFTTFSSFALATWELAGRLQGVSFALAYATAALLPILATFAGLALGAWTLPRRRSEGA